MHPQNYLLPLQRFIYRIIHRCFRRFYLSPNLNRKFRRLRRLLNGTCRINFKTPDGNVYLRRSVFEPDSSIAHCLENHPQALRSCNHREHFTLRNGQSIEPRHVHNLIIYDAASMPADGILKC